MPELPVKEIRPSELHLPEIKRDDIVRSLSQMRLPEVGLPRVELPTVELPTVELRRVERRPRFDWRSVDLDGVLAAVTAGAAAVSHATRPMVRRSRATVALGTIVVVGLIAAAAVATPAVRHRAGATVRRVRDRVDGRMTASDVLELDDDVAAADRPSAGELVTDGTMSAPASTSDGEVSDMPVEDAAVAG